MAASGLSTSGAVRPHLFGGLVAEFVARVLAEYRVLLKDHPDELKLVRNGWFYEPSVAKSVFRRFIEDQHERLRWLPEHWLERMRVQDHRIRKAVLTDGRGAPLTISARTFIDGTYQGDLTAAAKAPSRVGREGRQEYGESFAGIHYMNWRTGRQIMTPDAGEPSIAIQAPARSSPTIRRNASGLKSRILMKSTCRITCLCGPISPPAA